MSTSPFEIKVVYDATSRKRRGAVVRTSQTRTDGGHKAIILGGLLNLAVAGAMYYVTWQMADPYMGPIIIQKTPLTVPASVAKNPLGFAGLNFNQPTDEIEFKEISQDHADRQLFAATTSAWLIPVTALGWLALATAGACAIALAGGAWLTSVAGRLPRLLGLILAMVLGSGLGLAAWSLWAQFKTGYRVEDMRAGMGGLVLFFGLLGLALGARARSITKFSGVVVLIAAGGTVLGIWLWAHTGALDVQYAALPKLAAAFAIHAAWGIVLLVFARRIRV